MTKPVPLGATVQWMLVATAYALPLVVLPGWVSDAVEGPKLAWLALATAALGGAALARVLVWREPPWPATPVVPALLAWLAWAGIAALGAEAPAPAVEALLYLLAMVAAALLAASATDREALAHALLTAAAIVALYGLGQYVGFEPLPWSPHFKPRIFSTLGNPVFLGGFMATAFPLAFARWLTAEREETKDLLTLLLGALGLACYLTWTRGSWLATLGSSAVVLGVLAADARGRLVLKANRAWLLALAIAGVLAGSMVSSTQVLGNAPVPVADRVRDALNPRGYSFRFRLVTNEVALRIARDHPLLGAGPGNFPVAYPGRRLRTRAAAAAPEHYFASQEAYAHDDHAQILAESGVVGLGLWLWLLAAAFRWARARWRRGDWLGLAVTGCLAALVFDGALNFPLRIAPTAWMCFAALGLLGAKSPGPRQTPRPSTGLRASRPGAGWRPLAAAGLVAACAAAAVPPSWNRLVADHDLLEGDRQVGYNNFEMAAVYYGMGAERAPTDRFLAFRSSVAQYRSARFEWLGRTVDRALEGARRAEALGYRDENVSKHLSDIFARKTSIPKAVAALEQAHALHPRRSDIANNLAYYLAESGTRLDEALGLAREVSAREKGDPTFLDTLGWVEYKAGHRAAAERALRAALKAMPSGAGNPAAAAARSEVEAHLAKVRSGG